MINKVTLLGRIGKKEFKPTKTGGNFCALSIATNRHHIDSMGQKKETTTWHNVNFFNKIAEIANRYANVGDLIYIEGEISNKKIEDNGKNRIIHSIVGYELKLIPNQNNKKQSPAIENEEREETIGNKLDDIFSGEGVPF